MPTIDEGWILFIVILGLMGVIPPIIRMRRRRRLDNGDEISHNQELINAGVIQPHPVTGELLFPGDLHYQTPIILIENNKEEL